MASPLRTNIMEIGRAAIARLNLLEVVADPSQIMWSARKAELPHLKGKADLIVRPRKGQDIKAFEQGGQRYGMVCIRVIDFILRTSSALPECGTDEAWLDQHIPFEDALLNALAGQMLTDVDVNDYLTCPIHYLGTTEEVREEDPPVKHLWGNSVLSFEFHFKPKLDVSQLT
jgi:hypothetical protein